VWILIYFNLLNIEERININIGLIVNEINFSTTFPNRVWERASGFSITFSNRVWERASEFSIPFPNRVWERASEFKLTLVYIG
jgi:hypothetical protein